MGKTRDLFKKIRDTKGTFQTKMHSINDRNSRHITEAEDIKEYTEELYKKDLNDLDKHDGVIIYLEPNMLECEVKWALGRITTNKATGPVFSVHGILQARTLEWVAISFSNA